nr:cytidylate kinase-like family protein [uncultured Blautia sp.]
MEENQKKYTELANRIYDLDGEVYECVGSSLGRTFTGGREATVRTLSMLMYTKPDGHLLRSELALISNMARTIQDKEEKSRLMRKYNDILKEVEALPDGFGRVDILDQDRLSLNLAAGKEKISKDDHLVICISRTQGSAGNDIGFELADELKINYYDVEIFDQVLKRLEADRDEVNDAESFVEFNKYTKKKRLSLKERFREFNRYHGLNKQDAVFFNMSDLICNLAKTEDCIIMGRCADMILKNNHIPHISLFISAPFSVRTQHIMEVRNMNLKQAVRFLKKMDRQHRKYYEFYTGEKWGKPENYDLCINSANYGMKETIDVIRRMISR